MSTALLSAYLTDRYAKSRAKSEQMSEVKATKLAICIELQTVLNLYESFTLSPDEPKNGDDLTYSLHLIPTVFEVGDSRIQMSHAIPASRI